MESLRVSLITSLSKTPSRISVKKTRKSKKKKKKPMYYKAVKEDSNFIY